MTKGITKRKPRRGDQAAEVEPDGLANAVRAIEVIVDQCDALGDFIDWSEQGETADGQGPLFSTQARSRPLPASSAFNVFPANLRSPWFPVLLLVLPLDPTPGLRGQRAVSRSERYFSEGLWRAAEWADLAAARNAGPTHVLVLSDSWPLPPHPTNQKFPYDKDFGMSLWPSNTDRAGYTGFVGGPDSLHHVLGDILGEVPGVTVHFFVTPSRGDLVRLGERSVKKWPLGW